MGGQRTIENSLDSSGVSEEAQKSLSGWVYAGYGRTVGCWGSEPLGNRRHEGRYILLFIPSQNTATYYHAQSLVSVTLISAQSQIHIMRVLTIVTLLQTSLRSFLPLFR